VIACVVPLGGGGGHLEVENGRSGEGWETVETVIVLCRLVCALGVERVPVGGERFGSGWQQEQGPHSLAMATVGYEPELRQHQTQHAGPAQVSSTHGAGVGICVGAGVGLAANTPGIPMLIPTCAHGYGFGCRYLKLNPYPYPVMGMGTKPIRSGAGMTLQGPASQEVHIPSD